MKIAVADDHAMLREGVVTIIKGFSDVEVVGEASSVREAKQLLSNHRDVELLLCDINFPDGTGFDVLEYCRQYNSAAKVVFLTMHDKSSFATKAIEAGAMGYITKDSDKSELQAAVTAVRNGKKYFSQSIMSNIVENMSKPQEDHNFFRKVLSRRELEVLELIVEGRETTEIAEKLFISEKTAANYRISILQKCDVKNVVQLIKLYMQHA